MRILSFLLLLVVPLLCTSILSAGLELMPGQRTVAGGAVVTLPLELVNDGPAVGLYCEISYDPAALSLDPAGVVALQPSHDVLAAAPAAGLLRLVVNPRNGPFDPLPGGTVASLQVTVAPAAALGDHALTVTVFQAADEAGMLVVDASAGNGRITVRDGNQAPLANNVGLAAVEETPVGGVLLGTDGDGDPLSFALVDTAGKGSVVLTDATGGAFTYVPTLNAEGSDQFSFTVSDGLAVSDPATVSIVIAGRNDPPTAVAALIETDEDTVGIGIPLVTDVDAFDSHVFQIMSQGQHGTASVNGTSLSYLPDENFYGTDSFLIRATDSGTASVEGTAVVSVAPVNDPPQSAAAAFDLDEDADQSVVPTVVDVDDTGFRFAVIVPPQHGGVSVVGEALVYTPEADFNGEDRFVFRATDGGFAQVEAEAQITVHPVNDPPVAGSAALTACLDLSSDGVSPLVEDVDIAREGDSFIFSVLSQGEHGQAEVVDNQLVYTPDSGFSGEDHFAFRATDEAGASVDGTATVTVSPFERVGVSGPRAQGLQPLALRAGGNCGTGGIDFQWLDEDGAVLVVGAEILLSPVPTVTSDYELVGLDTAGMNERRHTFRILVHPAGVDLDGDGLNTAADLLLVVPRWGAASDPFEADGDDRLTVLDLLYINTDTAQTPKLEIPR